MTFLKPLLLAVPCLLGGLATPARADVIIDWNQRTHEVIADAKLATPPAVRTLAIVQTAAQRAVLASATAPAPASLEAAVAAAHRVTLAKLLPAQQSRIDAAYGAALTSLADDPARRAGVALGEQAATAVLAERLDDGAAAPEPPRVRTHAGAYVPTVPVAVPHWGLRKPWLLASGAQFRPAAPPAFDSATWVRDFREVKDLGAKASTQRNASQTAVARFWEYSLPAIYFGVVRSVAQQPGRDVARNAALYATVAQAMDDALISVFDAKYHHDFWRPQTAIRQADSDGNDSTKRDAVWLPLIEAPLHPEYPSAHSILAATVATVLQADLGSAPVPTLTTHSPTAQGAARSWTSFESFVEEVGNSRVWAGIHYRNSVDVGAQMGRRIGALAVQRQRVQAGQAIASQE